MGPTESYRFAVQAKIRASDRDDDLPAGVPLFEVSDGLGGVDQRKGNVDHGCDLAGLDELLQGDEVLLLHFRVQPAKPLTHEQGYQRRSEHPAEEATRPGSTPVATHDHEGPLRGEGAAQS